MKVCLSITEQIKRNNMKNTVTNNINGNYNKVNTVLSGNNSKVNEESLWQKIISILATIGSALLTPFK